MVADGRQRVIIENVKPEINGGRFPAKRSAGEKLVVQADIFVDGHDAISARLLYRGPKGKAWEETPMRFLVNDRWEGEFAVTELGTYHYTIEGWVDHFRSWQNDIRKKFGAGQDLGVDILIGLQYMEEALERIRGKEKKDFQKLCGLLKEKAGSDMEEAVSLALGEEVSAYMDKYPDKRGAVRYEKELSVTVDTERALFSSWYEFFPRSCPSESGVHGTFRDCENILPEIARMGFDVVYLPPVHPIGKTKRKGKNNSPAAGPEDAGSPWAIGAEEGGHKAIHPSLGTFADFEHFVAKAREYGMDVALDIAFQCSPDHPYVREHPEWFRKRPDGTVQYAENPPKKYEDIFPINFETENWQGLWEELKDVVVFWIQKGVRVFRVDNPHTKSFQFWEWLIREIKRDYPDVFFLSEAFTRPKIMYRLAKIGFAQSYTYFTWRYTQREFREYLLELTRSDVKEFFRPNFWPNTPDILPEHLQYGGRPAFIMRLILAATLSSSYGIYGPAFELCVNEALPGREEYLDSEKYEIKKWDWDRPGNLKDLIARINRIRRENPALQTLWNLQFYEVDNENLLFYGKASEDLSNILLVVINLDPFHTHSGWVKVPVAGLGIDLQQPYLVHDLLSDDKYIWQGERNYVELNPQVMPANIFRVRKRLKRETDFDYFM
ncbi:MAG: alpha-1,4-glucan--maltose-1-phosphate maltosyltransferase [Nitrospirota bacterium]|nr:alpha-1,4-glucan--maltose-1-phosphate maltosyltransferase [Nitrospirota bacterium]